MSVTHRRRNVKPTSVGRRAETNGVGAGCSLRIEQGQTRREINSACSAVRLAYDEGGGGVQGKPSASGWG